jgi:hypothetical protein
MGSDTPLCSGTMDADRNDMEMEKETMLIRIGKENEKKLKRKTC